MSQKFTELETDHIKLQPDTKIEIDGGLFENGGGVGTLEGRCPIDDYMLPTMVAVFRFEKKDAQGGALYVLDARQRYLIALKDVNGPSRDPLCVAIENQHKAKVTVDEITFNEALEIAHKMKKCDGIMFMDNLAKADFFHIKSTREAERNVD